MIKEAYCSYEVSKLLKEKGFEGECIAYYSKYKDNNLNLYRWRNRQTYVNVRNNSYTLVPTHQMAMAWLREVHHIAINIGWGEIFEDQYKWWSIVLNMDSGDILCEYDYHISYEQSCEAVLKYCLENLI